MKKTRAIVASFAFFAVMAVFLTPTALSATGPSNFTYTYNEWGIPVPSPDAYRVSAFILGDSLGIGHFDRPQDLHMHGNLLYVVDTYNNRIVTLQMNEDGTHELAEVVTSVTMPDGQQSTFDRPYGIFVSDWDLTRGERWIADTFNQRILHVDTDWNVITVIDRSKLELSLLAEQLDFLPRKIASDFSGRLFVQASHVNRGLMEFDLTGYFVGYMGAPDVSISPVDQFWRMIATREQRERMALFVPVEYNNVIIDNEGFLFVTTSSPDVDPIRRLNAMGADVMIRNGLQDPVGDTWYGSAAGISGPSTFMAAAALPNNTFIAFDSNRGRLFAYDSQGQLLYVWGGVGNREGHFILPTALVNMGFTLFALDATAAAITRFDLTEYGAFINDALAMYQRGLYEESVFYWQEVLRMNGNFGLAYIGMARAYLRQGYYRQAMDMFRIQNDSANFGRAFSFYRRVWMENYFWIFAAVIGVLMIVPPVVRQTLKVRREIRNS
ncbi:MAG: hypothetical protein FWG68_11870 [Defluviitaleaceae bacterium]|nr:hypothetical protein [Defluviitaleaceae bacterium]